MLQKVLILMALLGLVGCDSIRQPAMAPEPASPKLLRAYEVPPDRSQSIARSLSAALGETGSVSSVDNSRKILVLAPAVTHDSIARSLEALAEEGAVEAVESGDFAVQLDAWIVDAADTQDPTLAALNEVLGTLSNATGVRGFARYTSLSAQAIANNGTLETSDRRARIGAHFQASAGGVRAEVEAIDMSGYKVKVDTLLPFDRYIVLGHGAASVDGGSRFVIVRATKL